MKIFTETKIRRTYQTMEEDQNGDSNERIEAAVVQGGAVVRQNDGVIGNADNPKNKKDHDRTKPS